MPLIWGPASQPKAKCVAPLPARDDRYTFPAACLTLDAATHESTVTSNFVNRIEFGVEVPTRRDTKSVATRVATIVVRTTVGLDIIVIATAAKFLVLQPQPEHITFASIQAVDDIGSRRQSI